MASQGRGAKVLPKIRQSPPAVIDPAWQSARPPSRTTVRVEVLGDQARQQEATMQKLLDKAIRVKDEISETLNATHSNWQEEKHARELLQDHIRTITDVVRKLSLNVQVLSNAIHCLFIFCIYVFLT